MFLEAVLSPSLAENKNEIMSQPIAWNRIVQNIPSWLKTLFGTQPVEERCELIFQCLQYPVLNKQVSKTTTSLKRVALF